MLKLLKTSMQSILILGALILMFSVGCKKKSDDLIPKDLTFKDWRMIEKGHQIYMYYSDSSWAFVHRYEDFENDRIDSTVLGPFKGNYPSGNQFESFNETFIVDDEEERDNNRWVIEYSSSEGCHVVIIGVKEGKVVILKEYLLKNRLCSKAVFDEDLKYKTIFGTSDNGDSLDVLAINYDTGALLGRKKIRNGNFEDIEIINGHLIQISQRDSVYIDVTLSTDIKSKYAFPGTFVKAKENADGCKVIVLKSKAGFQSYVLCPKIPINHISQGNFLYGDEMTDLQTHYLRDSSRYVIGTYDSISNITRVDVLDKNAVRIGKFNDVGKQETTMIICNKTIKFFVLTDLANRTKKIRLNAIHINDGKNRILNPSTLNGEFVSIEASENPCGARVTYIDDNGNTQTTLVLIN